jgi:hypothetical protein
MPAPNSTTREGRFALRNCVSHVQGAVLISTHPLQNRQEAPSRTFMANLPIGALTAQRSLSSFSICIAFLNDSQPENTAACTSLYLQIYY